MDLLMLPSILWRRLPLILIVGAVVTAAVGFALRPGELAYETQVRVQLSTPQQEDVSLLNLYRPTNVRDEATLARNNYMVVLESPEVAERTRKGLRLSGGEASYSVDSRPLRDTDFIDVTVRATTPELAAAIADTHVNEAIRRYGELRAKPVGATRALLAQALQSASDKSQAEDAAASTSDEARQARESYQYLLKKYTEAMLAEEGAQSASYIQVVQPAMAGIHVATTRKFAILVGLGAVAGLGLGVVLAVLLESARRTARFTVEMPRGVRVEHYLDMDDQPIVTPPPATLRLPFPALPSATVALDPREQVLRGLKLARAILRDAEQGAESAPGEAGSAALRTLRAIVFDASKALQVGAASEDVARSFRANVEGVVGLLSLVVDSEVSDGPDLDAIVAEALEDEAALDLLRARTADPSVAARAILALAAVLEESVATNVVYLEPTPLRPFVEGVWRAAA